MKTRISRILLVVATVFTMGYARAAEPIRMNESKERSSVERNLDRALNRHLSFPLMEKSDMTGKVYVSFNVDRDGHVQVLSCESSNAKLRDYVLRKLAKVQIGANPDGIWKTTHMVIDFHPERHG